MKTMQLLFHFFGMPATRRSVLLVFGLTILLATNLYAAEGTRLLRQPDISQDHVVFAYGGDLWITAITGGDARRLTSTAAVESNPYFSPDGRQIAFTSNRSGTPAVYVLPVEGGTPTRLTWHPSGANVSGWTPDGQAVLYSSSRETAPSGYARLWTVPAAGGPSTLLPVPRGERASFGSHNQLIVEPISRWDSEWRAYRGGQNTALILTNLDDLSEFHLPNERTTDVFPVFLGDKIYFLSDRDWVSNIWMFDPSTNRLDQITQFEGADIKWLSGHGSMLVYEREGYIYSFDPANRTSQQIVIHVVGDFPWTETRLENVTSMARNVSLSPNGKRIILEARGEIFTAPVEDGSPRNLTRSTNAADRAPVWSPKGENVAWFSEVGGDEYKLLIANQDGLSSPRTIAIGESKMAWEPSWSPDGSMIAFVDDKTRIRIVDVATGDIKTIGMAGINIERGSMGISWSPDSKWLAYAKTGGNMFRMLHVWSVADGTTRSITNPMADSFSPSWDAEGKYLYFLASTDLALSSGWANTSAMGANPTHAAYLIVLSNEEKTPFPLKSDEEAVKSDDEKKEEDAKGSDKKEKTSKASKESSDTDKADQKDAGPVVRIDFDQMERRTLALPVPVRSYSFILAGPKGTAFLGERVENSPGLVLQKFTVEDKKTDEFAKGVSSVSLSENREKMLFRSAGNWRVVSTSKSPGPSEGTVNMTLRMQLDRRLEWQQIFNEAWNYCKNYLYDPGMHGRDWDEVRERYQPLIPYVRHRDDLNYVIDMLSGEMSVGHSFVFGGDFPDVDTNRTGMLGADYVTEQGRWKISRIYTAESWNPNLRAPLDEPGLKIKTGDFILAVNGIEFTAADDIFRYFDGTAGEQTTLHVNDKPSMDGARTITVSPINSENGLRQRAWVEDNRRLVDKLSDGKLAYVWVPNTSMQGVVNFNRYFFAQQDKEGAVIDERFNGGGLLDDYMVDLMTRSLRAAITNEVPGGAHFRLPAGILGPKVLLINELAGSGGDFFPWAFRNQQAGPLIGKRTWGGLVKSSVHYSFVDGGAMTAPDNAVFDPIRNEWIGENAGIPPDIEVHIDAKSWAEGRDIQLERAVQEALRLVEQNPMPAVTAPPYPRPAVKP
jgi:tricorn protease